MQAKYEYVPDKDKFVAFLSTFLGGLELAQAKLFHVEYILIDELGTSWELHYKAAAPIPERIYEKITAELTKRFNIVSLELVCDSKGRSVTKGSTQTAASSKATGRKKEAECLI